MAPHKFADERLYGRDGDEYLSSCPDDAAENLADVTPAWHVINDRCPYASLVGHRAEIRRWVSSKMRERTGDDKVVVHVPDASMKEMPRSPDCVMPWTAIVPLDCLEPAVFDVEVEEWTVCLPGDYGDGHLPTGEDIVEWIVDGYDDDLEWSPTGRVLLSHIIELAGTSCYFEEIADWLGNMTVDEEALAASSLVAEMLPGNLDDPEHLKALTAAAQEITNCVNSKQRVMIADKHVATLTYRATVQPSGQWDCEYTSTKET